MSYRRENEVGTGPAPSDRRADQLGHLWGNTVEGPGGRYGVQGGFGLQTGQMGNMDGVHGGSELLSANGFFGAREDNGTAWHGAGAHGKVAGFNLGYGQGDGSGWFGNFSADALGFDAEASLNPDKGAQLGAAAYLAQGALEVGHLSKDSGHDQVGRFGLAAGVGAAGRLHWDDADGDGIREIGLGADIGPVSFDFKSETLGQAYNWAEENVPAAWDATTDWVGNAWNTSTDAVGGAWNATTDAVAGGWNSTTDAIGSGWNSATDAIGGGLSAAGGAVASFFSGW